MSAALDRLWCRLFTHSWDYQLWATGQGSRLCVRCGLTEWNR